VTDGRLLPIRAAAIRRVLDESVDVRAPGHGPAPRPTLP
jgi:hypothetical protein